MYVSGSSFTFNLYATGTLVSFSTINVGSLVNSYSPFSFVLIVSNSSTSSNLLFSSLYCSRIISTSFIPTSALSPLVVDVLNKPL